MLRCIEEEEGWGKESSFEELMNEYSDKVDMMMMSENFSCVKMTSLWFLNMERVYLGN